MFIISNEDKLTCGEKVRLEGYHPVTKNITTIFEDTISRNRNVTTHVRFSSPLIHGENENWILDVYECIIPEDIYGEATTFQFRYMGVGDFWRDTIPCDNWARNGHFNVIITPQIQFPVFDFFQPGEDLEFRIKPVWGIDSVKYDLYDKGSSYKKDVSIQDECEITENDELVASFIGGKEDELLGTFTMLKETKLAYRVSVKYQNKWIDSIKTDCFDVMLNSDIYQDTDKKSFTILENVLLLENENIQSYEVFNLLGTKIETGKVTNDRIDLSRYKAGFYIVVFHSEHGKVTQKILID